MSARLFLATFVLLTSSGCLVGASLEGGDDLSASTDLSAMSNPDAADDGGVNDGDVDTDGASDGSTTDSAACVACQMFGTPTNNGAISSPLAETSGLAASRAHAGVLYTHNDSGGLNKFYAVADTGTLIATFTLQGAPTSGDYEDIDVGPCPAGTCVFIGDIGDNNLVRDDKRVLRVPEPNVAVGQAATSPTITIFDQLPFEFPGGAHHNAETLLVHPVTGDIYVATKEAAGVASTLYKFPRPFTPGTLATLTLVTQLPIPKSGDLDLSGGDIDPCGTTVLFRTSDKLYLLSPAPGAAFETVFSPPVAAAPYVVTVPVASETNGESIAWTATGQGYFTISEGAGEQLHRTLCAP